MTTSTGLRPAARMRTIGTESAFEVSARARALEAEGRSIIHLQIDPLRAVPGDPGPA
jgi:hypothetical protein